MHELRPFPVPDLHKVLKNRGFAWCEVGACRARCCALSLGTGTMAQPCTAQWHAQVGQHPREPAQAPRQGHRTSPKPPDTNHDKGVQSCRRRYFVSVRLSGNPSGCSGPYHGSVVEKCRHQQHAIMLPSKQHIKKKIHKSLKQCMLCVCWCHAGVLKSTSVRALGRLALGPGRADGAVAFIIT
jgi:hypothetical protein